MSFPLCFRFSARVGVAVTDVRHGWALISFGKVHFCKREKLQSFRSFPVMSMNSCVIARTKHTSHEPGADAVDKQTTSKILDQKLKNEENSKQKQISRKEQFKQAVKTYGMVVVVFHITITIASLSFFYVLVSSGLDVVDLLHKIGIGEAFLENHIAKGASTFLMAYAVHKLFVPARMAITLAATPVIVARLRQLGFLKNVS